MASKEAPGLRFAVGDRVECFIKDERKWLRGKVSDVNVRWDGNLIYYVFRPDSVDSGFKRVYNISQDKPSEVIAERSDGERLAAEMHEATQAGHSSTLRKLLKRATELMGADPALELLDTWEDPRTEQSILFTAIDGSNRVAVQLILAAGVPVDSCRSKDGLSPLHHACFTANRRDFQNACACVKALLDAAADPAQEWTSPQGSSFTAHQVARAFLDPFKANELVKLLDRQTGTPPMNGRAKALAAPARSNQTTIVQPSAKKRVGFSSEALEDHLEVRGCVRAELELPRSNRFGPVARRTQAIEWVAWNGIQSRSRTEARMSL